jgi:NAD(P)-dependent dehydrogenase (short-subunit alcohol dehydrogenase family)
MLLTRTIPGAYGASKAAMNHLCSTLAAEEPDLAVISIRPGVIDTQMQADIRTKHKNAMGEGNERFQALHREGKLLRSVLHCSNAQICR